MSKTRTSTKSRNNSSSVKKRAAVVQSKSGFDLFAAVLIVSLLANLFVVCIWVVLRVTDMYDAQLAEVLLAR